ncbi:MAG: tRNA (guanosine(37)-N1)-methyltransferase TrmD [Verrucomicrobiota bacterium]|nr:tRNA (guanosine(37)-N1)-methyltransferase TrmD [Verrucomicrobiota bacterium]
MRIVVLTLFPSIVTGPLQESIIKRGQQKGLVEINVRNLRDWTHDRHHTADDKPYGGGHGMLMKPEPIFEAIDEICGAERKNWRIVLMTPSGKTFNQAQAREFAQNQKVLILCGHYEGIDERVREALVTDEISIGDYVLTNGALSALVVIDAVVRLIPGVIGDEMSNVDESFSDHLLEYPQYTRPEEYRGMRVPDVLLSGNHQEIAKWRKEQAEDRTKQRRPDLLK